MPAAGAIRVQGLRELQRAFKVADATLHRELRDTLRHIAEPVRADAEQLAATNIRKIGLPWSQMRVGVTQRSVYVAPKKRSGRNPSGRRPNLAGLLLGQAMMPALEQNRPQVVAELEHMLATVARAWER